MADTGGSFGGRKIQGAGGTPGGIGEFFLGVGLAAAGLLLIMQQIQVHTPVALRIWGNVSATGPALLATFLGIGRLFFNGRSLLGWGLVLAGVGIVIVGVVMNMDVYFQRASLAYTIAMFGLLAGGLGLIVKSLRPHPVRNPTG